MANGLTPITVHFPKYAKYPKIDPHSKHPIPEPEPEKRDVSEYQYVDIPQNDIFNKPFQGVSINGEKFERGKRYFVEPGVAEEIRRLIAQAQKADMRILQSHPDQPKVSGDHGPLGQHASEFGL